MLKHVNRLVALATVLGVAALVAAMSRGLATKDLELGNKEIRINGQGYTLASLATAINDPDILSYDPATRQAQAKASIVIRGSLQVGDPSDKALGETLVLDTVVCGDLRLEVASGGSLKLFNSTITTKSEMLTVNQCSQGYAFIVNGQFEAADSTVLYMSGTTSKLARNGARVTLDRVSFRQCDGSAFQTDRADGERLAIEDCQFIGAGAFGVLVDGSGGEPITFRNCVLSGQMSDLALRGSRPSVVLVDCQFGRGRIGFYHRSGRAAIQWTAKVKVVEKGSGRPVAGAQVVATGSGEEPEAAEATTGPDGACSLVLTEYVATAELPMRADGRNTQTPHRIVARRDGRVLAEQSYDARGPAGQVTLDVPPPS